MILSHGDTGAQVAALQQRLVEAGYELEVDGWYGDATERAVRAYQATHDLVTDGVAGPVTLGMLCDTPPANPTLTHSDLTDAAAALSVDLPSILAVTEVEAKGSGFVAPNRPAILFERHVMLRRMQEYGADTSGAEREHPDLVNQSPGGYVGGLDEHIRLIRAQSIFSPAAPEAASWGLFQIMGYHWQRLGYASQYEFVDKMTGGEAGQLDAFVRFVLANDDIHQALADRDWQAFARGYNGPNYEINDYDTRLMAAYRRHLKHAEVAA